MSGLLRTNPKDASASQLEILPRATCNAATVLIIAMICLFKPMVVSELSKRVTELRSPMFIRLS